MSGQVFIQGITAILGEQGSGKSYAAIKVGCMYAEQIKYDICFNFEINLEKLYEYCLEMGYLFLASRILKNKITYKSSSDLAEFMDRPKTLYILDEAGVYLNTRDFMKLDREFMHSLAQVRHDQKILWYIAQYHDMVDKILRSLTASFIQVESSLRFNKQLGNSELIWQRIYLYNARKYKIYLGKVHDKLTGIKYWVNARRLADFHWEGMLSYADKLIFEIYQSFGYRVGDEDKRGSQKKQFNQKVIYVNYNEDFLDKQEEIEEEDKIINPFIESIGESNNGKVQSYF